MIDNILIVEDETEICDAIEIYLKTQNYHVFKAHNGIEGLDIVEKETIHLAIVDIMMPVMDGIQMTMKMREKYDFPIIKSNNFGHIETKIVIPIGAKAKIDTNSKEKISLLEDIVSF